MKVILSILFFIVGSLSPAWSLTENCLWILSQEIPDEHRPDSLSGISRPYIDAVALNEQGYRLSVPKDVFGPHQIIFVDSLPTDIDPPFVAAIITGTPIPEGSHAREMAELMGVPILYRPDWMQDPEILKYISSHNSNGKRSVIEVDAGNGAYGIRASKPEDMNRRPKVVLPPGKVNQNATEPKRTADIKHLPVEELRLTYGEKNAYLIWASNFLDAANLPHMVHLPVGTFIKMLKDIKLPDGMSLHDFIKASLGVVEDGDPAPTEHILSLRIDPENMDQVRRVLERIRNEIDRADIHLEVKSQLTALLKEEYGSLNREYKERTSTPDEDSTGAGTYASQTLPESPGVDEASRMQQFVQKLKDVFTSFYSFRAFNLRNLIGLKEGNSGMGVLIHPTVSGETLTGITKVKEINGTLVFRVVAYPGKSSATSPDIRDKKEVFTVYMDPAGDTFFKKGTQRYSTREHGDKFLSLVEDELRFANFEIYMNILEVASTVHNTWKKQNPNSNVEFSFEWVNTRSNAPETSRPINTPVILQIKKKDLTPRTPLKAASHWDEATLASFKNNHPDPELAAALRDLPEDYMSYRDYVYSQENPVPNSLPKVKFFFVELDAKPQIIVTRFSNEGQVINHAAGADDLRAYFHSKGVTCEFLEYGQLPNIRFTQENGKVKINIVQIAGIMDNDTHVLPNGNEVNRIAMKRLLMSLTEPGVIEFAPGVRAINGLERYSGIQDRSAMMKELVDEIIAQQNSTAVESSTAPE